MRGAGTRSPRTMNAESGQADLQRRIRGVDRDGPVTDRLVGETSVLGSRQDVPHDLPVYIREAEVTALKAVSELFVVEAEEVQNRRLKIVNMNFVAGH